MGGVEGNLHSLQSSAHGGELRITADFTDMLTARYPFGRKVLLTRYQNRSEQTNSKKQTIMPAASHFIDWRSVWDKMGGKLSSDLSQDDKESEGRGKVQGFVERGHKQDTTARHVARMYMTKA